MMRDFAGSFEAAATCVWHTTYDPLVSETKGIREALSWMKFKNFKNVEVETDCLIAVKQSMNA